jgi:hypothetical protein
MLDVGAPAGHQQPAAHVRCVMSTATGGKAVFRTRSSVETGKKRGPQGRAAKQGRKRKAGVVIKGN